MTLISPAHPEFRKFLLDQFVELVRDGADGFQLDKTGVAGMLDFNPDLPTSPDRSMTEGILATFREILQKCREVNPEFALASEICWDRAFPFVDVSYVRMNDIDMNSPALALHVSRVDLDDLRGESGRLQRDEQRHAVWVGVGRAAPPLQ